MKIIAHRGITSDKVEENSFLAIKSAINDKETQGVEFDIRLTKDNKIVLSHDNIVGINIIENTNYYDLIKKKYLTTLDKVLDVDTDKIFLIDIKTNNNYKLFGDILLKYLEGVNKNIYLASFDKKIIKYLKSRVQYKVGIISFYYRRQDVSFYVINYKFIRRRKIKSEVFLWTIDYNNRFDIKNDYNYYLICNITRGR